MVYDERHNSKNYGIFWISWNYQWEYFVGNGDFTMKHGDIMGIFSGGKTMPFKLAMTGNGIAVYHIYLW